MNDTIDTTYYRMHATACIGLLVERLYLVIISSASFLSEEIEIELNLNTAIVNMPSKARKG